MEILSYELAMKLKDAGFPQFTVEKSPLNNASSYDRGTDGTIVFIPTLTELIEACGDGFEILERITAELWAACSEHEFEDFYKINKEGATPEEAVANLWLALNTHGS